MKPWSCWKLRIFELHGYGKRNAFTNCSTNIYTPRDLDRFGTQVHRTSSFRTHPRFGDCVPILPVPASVTDYLVTRSPLAAGAWLYGFF